MSVRDKILVEIRQAGKIVAEWQTNCVPSMGESVIINGYAFVVNNVVWSRDQKGHYDAWVQVLIETVGRQL